MSSVAGTSIGDVEWCPAPTRLWPRCNPDPRCAGKSFCRGPPWRHCSGPAAPRLRKPPKNRAPSGSSLSTPLHPWKNAQPCPGSVIPSAQEASEPRPRNMIGPGQSSRRVRVAKRAMEPAPAKSPALVSRRSHSAAGGFPVMQSRTALMPSSHVCAGISKRCGARFHRHRQGLCTSSVGLCRPFPGERLGDWTVGHLKGRLYCGAVTARNLPSGYGISKDRHATDAETWSRPDCFAQYSDSSDTRSNSAA